MSFDLAAIYGRYHRMVAWIVRGYGVPERSIDDVIQDVFVALHRRRDGAPTGDMRRWVVGVARSVSHSHQRAAARRRDRLAEIDPPTPPPTAEERLDDRFAVRRMQAGLRDIDPDQREAFVLIELEGLSPAQAAQTVGANVNTVYSRLRLARRKLANVVRDDERVRRSWAIVAARVGLEPVVATSVGTLGGLAIGATLGAAALAGILVGAPTASAQPAAAIRAPALRPAAPMRVAVASPALVAPPPDAQPVAPPPAPQVAPDRRPRPPAVEPTRPPPSLAEEAQLLRDAAQQIDTGDLDAARRTLSQHQRKFSRGALRDERERLGAEIRRRQSKGTRP